MDDQENVQQLTDVRDSDSVNESASNIVNEEVCIVTRVSTPVSGLGASDQHHPKAREAWVTRRNPVGEITSLISSLYLSEADEHEEQEIEPDVTSFYALPALTSLNTELGSVIEKVN